MTTIDIYNILRKSLRREAKLFAYSRIRPRADQPCTQVHVEIKEGEKAVARSVKRLCQKLLHRPHTPKEYIQCFPLIVPEGIDFGVIIQARPLIMRYVKVYDVTRDAFIERLDMLFRWEKL